MKPQSYYFSTLVGKRQYEFLKMRCIIQYGHKGHKETPRHSLLNN